jgi:hypothetical protein
MHVLGHLLCLFQNFTTHALVGHYDYCHHLKLFKAIFNNLKLFSCTLYNQILLENKSSAIII